MSAPAVHVSIVIPCYQEQETVPRLLEALDGTVEQLAAAGYPAEVIVVDDGSRDNTWQALTTGTEQRPWLRLVRLRRNFGQTAAMAAGFERARGEVVVPLDADMQNDPADILPMLHKLEEGYDVVSGWRKQRQDKGLTRRLPSKVANWLIGRSTGLKIHDLGCSLKAYRRDVLQHVRLYGEMHRFIPIYAMWAGARVTEMEVRHHPRTEGQSKYGLERTFKVLLDLLTVKFLGDFSTKPIYLFGGLGAGLCSLGVIAGVVVLIQKFVFGAWAHANPLLLLAVMLFIVGMQLIAMGLLAELQVRTYHESQHKPIYLVAQEVNAPCAELPASSSPTTEPSTSARSA